MAGGGTKRMMGYSAVHIDHLHPDVRRAIRDWLENGEAFDADLPILPGQPQPLKALPDRRNSIVEGTRTQILLEVDDWPEPLIPEGL